MKKTTKSAAVLDVLENGNIYIEAGAPDNLITHLGASDTGKFRPYRDKVKDVSVLYPYVIHKDYIPANYKSIDEFIQMLDSQVDSNAYIQNYLRIGAETLASYLKGLSLIDPKTWVLSIDSGNRLTEQWFNYFVRESGCKGASGMFMIDSDVDPEMLSVSSNADGDTKKRLGDILNTIQRVDRSYDFSTLKFSNEELRNLDGLLQVDSATLSKIPLKSMVIILGDFVDSGAPLNEAYRKLTAMGHDVLFAVGIAKKIS